MNYRLMVADICDVFGGILISQIQVSEILDWVYMILLIISISFGIGLKIYSAFKDGRVTEEEAKEIKKAVDEAKEEVKKTQEEDKK